MVMEKRIGFSIRPFEPKDQDECKRLVLSGLAGHFGALDLDLNEDLNDIEASYPASGNIFLVVECGIGIIGAGALIFETGVESRIARLSVSQTARRSGVGEAIVRKLIAAAEEAGSQSINVETNHDWHAARNLYTKLGFAAIGSDEESVHFRLDL